MEIIMDKFKSFLASKWHIIVMVVLVIVISYPALFMVMAKGHDLNFHLMRGEGIRQDISLRNFPVRMQSNWIDGYGYPVSILYGDIFLYLFAFFRMCQFALMPAFRLFIVCVNTATVIIAYNSFKTIFEKKETALVSTILYATAPYRLVDEYVRSAVGETLTIVFLPAVVACICVIYREEEAKTRRKASLILSLVITSIICAHTLTTSMLGVVIVPGFLAGLFLFDKKGDRLKRFWNMVTAAIVTAFLAAFFLVPFMDFYLNAGIEFALDNGMNIQGEGLTLWEMFNFYGNPFGGDGSDIQKSPGIVLMTVLICAVIFIIVSTIKKRYVKDQRRIVFETVFAIVLMFMTSCVFPWNFIEYNVPLGGVLTAIEFPMRYMAFALVFLAMLAGDMFNVLTDTIKEKCEVVRAKKIIVAIVSVAAIFCICNMINVCVHTVSYGKKALFMEVEDLGRWDYYALDFQLKNTDVKTPNLGIKQEGLLSMEVVSRDSNDWMIACVSGPDYGWIQLPMFNYPYYYAVDVEDPSKVFEIHEGANRTVGVLLPASYSGILHVYWREPMLWRIMELISAVTFLGILTLLFYDRIRKRIMK